MDLVMIIINQKNKKQNTIFFGKTKYNFLNHKSIKGVQLRLIRDIGVGGQKLLNICMMDHSLKVKYLGSSKMKERYTLV